MKKQKIQTGAEISERYNSTFSQAAILNDTKEGEEETRRTLFRRHKDRILYSGGFRRLQDKTQVLSATKNGDHRTRLTHTLEVEQIATSISDALSLNRDLASAIAYGHDIGHTPFGHAAERVLNDLLEGCGGFSHAIQSVRFIKNKNIEVDNLILEGILKHDTDIFVKEIDNKQFDCANLKPNKLGFLEAQVVYWADKLAYLSHDFEDFYNNGFYDKLKKSDSEQTGILRNILSDIIGEQKIKEDISYFKIRDLIRNLLENLIETSYANITQILEEVNDANSTTFVDISTEKFDKKKEKINTDKIAKIEGAKKDEEKKKIDKDAKEQIKRAFSDSLIINLDDKKRKNYFDLRALLDKHYIMSSEVASSDAKAKKIVKSLFDDFTKNINLLPLEIKTQIDSDKKNEFRIVADYICSMTDSYAEEVYFNLNFPRKSYNY